MSFTPNEIFAIVNSWLGLEADDVIAEKDGVKWVNEGIVSIGGQGWDRKSQQYSATSSIWYSLPTDFVSMESVVESIGAPTGLTVTPTGTPGTTTYGYQVTAYNASGETLACTEVTTTTGNATLSSTNYNALAWTEVTGATGYRIYRTTGGSTTGYIGEATTTESFNDTGIAGDNGSIPVIDYSGDAYTYYEIRGDKIRFRETGTYAINYVAYPATVTGAWSSIAMNNYWRLPLAKFVASRYSAQQGNTDAADRWAQEFADSVTEVFGTLETGPSSFHVKLQW